MSAGSTTTDDGCGVLPLAESATADKEPVASTTTAWSSWSPAASKPTLPPDSAVSPARWTALFGCIDTVVELTRAGPDKASVVGVLPSPSTRREDDPGANTNVAIF